MMVLGVDRGMKLICERCLGEASSSVERESQELHGEAVGVVWATLREMRGRYVYRMAGRRGEVFNGPW